jgi:hypothetical protein
VTPTAKTVAVWGTALAAVIVLRLVAVERGTALRAVLLVAATGEALAGVAYLARAPHMAVRAGRPYDPAYHGVMQDFGFYNLAIAYLLAASALDAAPNATVMRVAIGLYGAHGIAHLLRFAGLYFGGERPLATRPRHLELRDGLQLLGPMVGMLLLR